MAISKRFRYKDKEGKVTDYEYGVNGPNVTQDANHRLVTDKEKETWNGKANPEDIPSGAAADYGVANNDTTNRSDMLVTAQVAYQHGREIDQLISETDKLNIRCQRYADHSGSPLASAIDLIFDAITSEIGTGFFSWLVNTNQGYFALFGYMSSNITGIATQIVGNDAYSFSKLRGADTVLKKLGEPKIATFSVSVNANHPSMTWTAPGKIIRAGLTGAGSTTDPGGNSGPSLSCTWSGNVVTVGLWKFGGNCSAQGFVIYE